MENEQDCIISGETRWEARLQVESGKLRGPKRISAGLLMFRWQEEVLEVFLVHPGGPFWRNRDAGAWSIPKGQVLAGEDELLAAQREFAEETGTKPEGQFISLGEIKQAGGKIVRAWGFEGDSSTDIRSNTFSMEWPPKSGKMQDFPEADRAEWFSLRAAREKINPGQRHFLERLQDQFSARN